MMKRDTWFILGGIALLALVLFVLLRPSKAAAAESAAAGASQAYSSSSTAQEASYWTQFATNLLGGLVGFGKEVAGAFGGENTSGTGDGYDPNSGAQPADADWNY